jgi:hypothetical protein
MADLEDWIVLDDGIPIGRIYQRHAPANADVAWFWSITEYVEPRPPRCDEVDEVIKVLNRTAEILRDMGHQISDAAKAAFQNTWDKWRDWATQAGFDSSSG